LLLEALRIGNAKEQALALEALFRRNTVRGLGGVIGLYETLPEDFKLRILRDVKLLHHALREAGRSDDSARRLAAMKLIALGRQGKLAYVLSENLHAAEESFQGRTEAMVALARWVATEHAGSSAERRPTKPPNRLPPSTPKLMEQRPKSKPPSPARWTSIAASTGRISPALVCSCATGPAAKFSRFFIRQARRTIAHGPPAPATPRQREC